MPNLAMAIALFCTFNLTRYYPRHLGGLPRCPEAEKVLSRYQQIVGWFGEMFFVAYPGRA